MGNIILYGPPGTGKTYKLQKLQEKYFDYEFSDSYIRSIYTKTGNLWLTIAMLLLKNKNEGSTNMLVEQLRELSISLDGINTTLIMHNIENDILGNNKEPRVFEEFTNNENEKLWKVKISNLENTEFNKFLKNGKKSRFEFITFHQSFTYENFIEGIRPSVIDGQVEYNIEMGIFKELCDRANSNGTQRYALFIDEINRGNIEEIFGETISLIELDKRLGEKNELVVTLPYSKEKFGIPKNIDIYGTMNSADKSTISMDMALRRRFEFKKIADSEKTLTAAYINEINVENIDGINLIQLIEKINDRIELLLDENYKLGSAYFIGIKKFVDIKNVLLNKVIPLMEEYFFDDLEKIQLIFNDLDENGELKKNAIYRHRILEPSNLFEYMGDVDIVEKKKFFVTDQMSISSITKIYE